MKGLDQLGVSVPDGGTILLGGIMEGRGSCEETICVIDTEVRAVSRGGAKVWMIERVTLDLASRMVRDIEVLKMFLDFYEE